ncbi:MAG: hypothetical protein HY000_00450 [Planctomycetes bacterium]|nr:hypothetical protein [Planctomycetota bacterium]
MKPVRHRRSLLLFSLGLIITVGTGTVSAHDVPDRFFDRSIQVTLGPEKLSISYHLSLTQLTLAEELLSLVGAGGLAGTGPAERLTRYGEEMGPLIARGLIVKWGGVDVPVQLIAVSSRMEDHPRFTFELAVTAEPDESLPCRLDLEDTSFFLEKGSVRIAIRAGAGCEMVRSTVPTDPAAVAVRPSWELSPEQQDEARRAEASWRVNSVAGGSSLEPDSRPGATEPLPSITTDDSPAPAAQASARSSSSGRQLLGLLDRGSGSFALVLLVLAFFFGSAHALTPGHGKTMVAAYLVGERGTLQHAVGLGLTTSLTHTGSVLVVAAILALISPSLERKIHTGFSLLSGVLVAGLGAWLLVARMRSGIRSSADERANRSAEDGACASHSVEGSSCSSPSNDPGWGGLLTLGISGGMVPCWDAVALLLFAAAEGQLARAFFLLLSFSAGLAATLVAVGVLAVQFRGFLTSRLGSGRIVQRLPVLSAAAILAVGLYLCVLTLHTPGATATLTSVIARWTAKP